MTPSTYSVSVIPLELHLPASGITHNLITHPCGHSDCFRKGYICNIFHGRFFLTMRKEKLYFNLWLLKEYEANLKRFAAILPPKGNIYLRKEATQKNSKLNGRNQEMENIWVIGRLKWLSEPCMIWLCAFNYRTQFMSFLLNLVWVKVFEMPSIMTN